MQSGRPKWVPTYAERQFDDGRAHTAKWTTLFASPDGSGTATALNQQQFMERAAALAFAMPLGPSGYLQPSEMPSDAALEALWVALNGDAATLTAAALQERLAQWSADGHSVQWQAFQQAIAPQ